MYTRYFIRVKELLKICKKNKRSVNCWRLFLGGVSGIFGAIKSSLTPSQLAMVNGLSMMSCAWLNTRSPVPLSSSSVIPARKSFVPHS